MAKQIFASFYFRDKEQVRFGEIQLLEESAQIEFAVDGEKVDVDPRRICIAEVEIPSGQGTESDLPPSQCRIGQAGDEPPKSRLVYTIRPISYHAPLGDSGRIDGREGAGETSFLELPITGEDGAWLEFETYEAAHAEALKRGFDHRNVARDWITVVMPEDWLSHEDATP